MRRMKVITFRWLIFFFTFCFPDFLPRWVCSTWIVSSDWRIMIWGVGDTASYHLQNIWVKTVEWGAYLYKWLLHCTLLILWTVLAGDDNKDTICWSDYFPVPIRMISPINTFSVLLYIHVGQERPNVRLRSNRPT